MSINDNQVEGIFAEIYRNEVLMMAESVISTDVSGRTFGAPPLCTISEIEFLLEAIAAAASKNNIDEPTFQRVSELFMRGGKSDYALLRGAERRFALVRLVE